MSLPGQRIQPGRYTIIPRSLTFLFAGEEVLLLRIAEGRGSWSGLLNGIGGHIEQGEDPRSAALREIEEETGLVVDPSSLYLSGVGIVDVGDSPGIGLYIFVAEINKHTTHDSGEGTLEWIALEEMTEEKLVEDLPELIHLAMKAYHSKQPFSAQTSFDSSGNPIIRTRP
jgi:8-oxo-dGTP diphosphatase